MPDQPPPLVLVTCRYEQVKCRAARASRNIAMNVRARLDPDGISGFGSSVGAATARALGAQSLTNGERGREDYRGLQRRSSMRAAHQCGRTRGVERPAAYHHAFA